MKFSHVLRAAACILFISCNSGGGNKETTTDSTKGSDSTVASGMPPRNPEKNCYFGSTHTHSTMSFDAYNLGSRTTPDQTYDFDAGGQIEYMGL
ncbi:MAG TPA: DUF3604 domain-containing protein, partial [Puia sp.]|nr:DUF3604 domain-containing protein [Puia sp.]